MHLNWKTNLIIGQSGLCKTVLLKVSLGIQLQSQVSDLAESIPLEDDEKEN
jgi:hypothetical protein